jgi:hypothetical protein
MKRHHDKMSDSLSCKQQKTAKEEEVPNSLLSLPKEILQYCIAFVGKDTIDLWVVSVNKSTKYMPMNTKTVKNNLETYHHK